MEEKYADLVKKLPFVQDEQSSFKSSFLVGKSFLGFENLTMRFGSVGKPGPIVEEINEMHTHDYDQLILFYSTSPDDMLGLGATVEVAVGETGERHKFTVPTAVTIPKGTPHFPARVLSMDRDIYYLSLSCAPEVKAIPYATELTPESGQTSAPTCTVPRPMKPQAEYTRASRERKLVLSCF